LIEKVEQRMKKMRKIKRNLKR